MSGTLFTRLVMALLAANQAVLGTWACLAPRSFFDEFPFRRGWVASLPPFNEHLVRDVGGLSLGFAVLFTAAALTPRAVLVRPILYAWLVPATTHLVFHLDHLAGFSTADASAQSFGLWLVVALPILVLIALRREEGSHRDLSGTSAASSH